MRLFWILALFVICSLLCGQSDGGKVKEKIKAKAKSILGGSKNKNTNTNFGTGSSSGSKKNKYGGSSSSSGSNKFKNKPYKPKKSGSKKMLKLLAGGAGAYLGYKAGKKVLKMAGRSMMFGGHYGNRHYYFQDSMYGGLSNQNRQTCRVNVEQEQDWSDIFLPDGRTQVRVVIFECDAFSQYCCDMDCCTKRSAHVVFSWWHGLIILLILSCCCCCGAFLFYKFCKSGMAALRSMVGRGEQNGEFEAVPMQDQRQPDSYPPAPGGYPPQPPPDSYPPQHPQPAYGFDQHQQPAPPPYAEYPPNAAQPHPAMYPNVQQPYSDYPVKA